MVTTHNTDLSEIFHRMASCYRYKGNEDRFRALAYEGASRTMNNLKEDVSVYATNLRSLDQLKGIGEGIAKKILEFLATGKIKTYELLKKEVPQELLELMDINGLGPDTIKILHEELKIDNKEELITAIEKGKLKKLKGFGAKKVENILRGLKIYKESQSRMLLSGALKKGNEILNIVLKIPGIKKAELAGSLRRKKETIGDIDILAVAERKSRKKIISSFISIPHCDRVLASGNTKASILLKNGKTQVDLRLFDDHEYGSALIYFTGSKEHNIQLRQIAKSKGWKLNEYGLFDEKTGKRLSGNSEEGLYRYFGLNYIPPELREQRGEIEKAARKKLPQLVELKEIRGDMQLHSTWSDGAEDIETIAKYILNEFPQYEYIVLTDHSPSERIAGGLQPPEFRKQFAEINRVNKKIGKDLVKKGVEVDILTDGSMDLPEDLLEEFDWVVASIHSGFKKDNTERFLKACEHPFVHCIGHPSGRLIGKREGYQVDWKRLFAKAAVTGTAIEINAQPERMDLKDDLVKEAIELGVSITISTDAHTLTQFEHMSLGVAVARRGWCSKENILNTFPWKEIERFTKRKQKTEKKPVNRSLLDKQDQPKR